MYLQTGPALDTSSPWETGAGNKHKQLPTLHQAKGWISMVKLGAQLNQTRARARTSEAQYMMNRLIDIFPTTSSQSLDTIPCISPQTKDGSLLI